MDLSLSFFFLLFLYIQALDHYSQAIPRKPARNFFMSLSLSLSSFVSIYIYIYIHIYLSLSVSLLFLCLHIYIYSFPKPSTTEAKQSSGNLHELSFSLSLSFSVSIYIYICLSSLSLSIYIYPSLSLSFAFGIYIYIYLSFSLCDCCIMICDQSSIIRSWCLGCILLASSEPCLRNRSSGPEKVCDCMCLFVYRGSMLHVCFHNTCMPSAPMLCVCLLPAAIIQNEEFASRATARFVQNNLYR